MIKLHVFSDEEMFNLKSNGWMSCDIPGMFLRTNLTCYANLKYCLIYQGRHNMKN